MGATKIIIQPNTSEQEGMMGALTKWCRDHDISQQNFFLTIFPQILFCLHHYTRADVAANAVVTLNLGEITILTRANNIRKPKSRKPFDSVL